LPLPAVEDLLRINTSHFEVGFPPKRARGFQEFGPTTRFKLERVAGETGMLECQHTAAKRAN
jgi:hypothetical protein